MNIPSGDARTRASFWGGLNTWLLGITGSKLASCTSINCDVSYAVLKERSDEVLDDCRDFFACTRIMVKKYYEIRFFTRCTRTQAHTHTHTFVNVPCRCRKSHDMSCISDHNVFFCSFRLTAKNGCLRDSLLCEDYVKPENLVSALYFDFEVIPTIVMRLQRYVHPELSFASPLQPYYKTRHMMSIITSEGV